MILPKKKGKKKKENDEGWQSAGIVHGLSIMFARLRRTFLQRITLREAILG
jgi:hypothetical protein